MRTLASKGPWLLVALGLGAYVVTGGATAEFGVAQGTALALWALLLAGRVRRKLRETSDAGLLLDVEVGVAASRSRSRRRSCASTEA